MKRAQLVRALLAMVSVTALVTWKLGVKVCAPTYRSIAGNFEALDVYFHRNHPSCRPSRRH